MKPLKRYIYIGLGTLFLGLGTLGIFLPVLPTTPFWLLTCWFYIRSSEALYRKVMANRYFGNYVKAYMEDKSIPLRGKVISLSVMWVSILCTIIFFVPITWVRILLFLISVGVTIHILSFPTRKKEKEIQ
ncbi:YbaN family protein [Parabacteroides sp. OttesenSCG-928-G06]|nr:YbaN family protein [Parabacteroides sp. OttesenSCG-928-K15]MDL2282879.1 YbaN family protein [Parabacteroides sp. OttesenSCG-928-G06]